MRKYDIKNKRNIGIIIVISMIIIIMFSLCIKFILSFDRNEYVVSKGAIVFDVDKSIIKLDMNGVIKNKWNNDYYLIYNDMDYELGDTAISYDENTGEIKLYGKYYEISGGNEITVTDNETVIKSSLLTKFYKLSDRKYLVIDKDIKSTDGLLSTSEFLMIDLDKVGNATLTNHNVSLKTFSSSTIVTSSYTFDIANEILTYGSDIIDLKKIIGSSNTYTKEELIPEENKGNQIGNNSTGVTDNTNNDSDNGNNEEGNRVTIEEIKKHAKKTSVIAVTSTIQKINVDYVIYDPKNEYSSVYMEVRDIYSDNTNTYYLNKNETSYEIFDNIFPSSLYEIKFKYSYMDEENNLKTDIFDTVEITTKKPELSLKVMKVRGTNIHYLITTDNSGYIDSALLTILVNDNIYLTNRIQIDGNKTDSISISDLSSNDKIEFKLTDVKYNDRLINGLTASYKFKY